MTTSPSEVDRLITTLRETIESAGEFIIEQAPPLAQEIVWYGRIANTGEAIVFGAITIYCIQWFIRHIEAYKLNYVSSEFAVKPTVLGAIGVGAFFATMADTTYALKAWVAPGYYVLGKVLGMLP